MVSVCAIQNRSLSVAMRVAIQVRICPAVTILSLFSRELNNSVICYESLTIGWSMVFVSSIDNHASPVVMRIEQQLEPDLC